MELYFNKIRNLRDATGLQTKVFCQKLDISVSTLWHWEKGSKTPTEKKVRKLAALLNVPVEQISNLTSESHKSEHNLSGSIKLWGEDSQKHSEEAISQFKYMVSKISEQYEYLTQYTLITNAILSSIESIIYIKVIQQKYLFTNNSFLKNLSLNSDFNINGKNDNDFFTPKEAKQITEQDRIVISSGKPIKNIDGYLPGSRKKKFGLFSTFPIFDSNKKIAGVIGVINDITDRKKMVRTQEILGIYIDAMTDCLYGYKPEVFYNNRDYWQNNCIHPEDKDIQNKTYNQSTWENESNDVCRIIRADGKIRWIEGKSATKVFFGIKCLAFIERDITDNMINKEQIAKSARIEMARSLKEAGFDLNTIAKSSKLSLEEIRKLS